MRRNVNKIGQNINIESFRQECILGIFHQSWEKWWGVPQAFWISLCVPGLFQVNTHKIRHVNWHDKWGMHKQYKYCDIIEWFLLKFGWILLKNVNFECWQSKCSWRITECSASVLALLAGFLNSAHHSGEPEGFNITAVN